MGEIRQAGDGGGGGGGGGGVIRSNDPNDSSTRHGTVEYNSKHRDTALLGVARRGVVRDAAGVGQRMETVSGGCLQVTSRRESSARPLPPCVDRGVFSVGLHNL